MLVDKVMQLSPDVQLLQQLEQLSSDDQTDNKSTGSNAGDDIEELNKTILGKHRFLNCGTNLHFINQKRTVYYFMFCFLSELSNNLGSVCEFQKY